MSSRAVARVLVDGVPPLPDRLRERVPTPVAAWGGSRYGAVMVIEDCEHDDFCDDTEHFVAMTYTFRQRNGEWEASHGQGGTDWPGGTDPSVRSVLAPNEVLLEGGPAGSDETWICQKVDGFAGRDAAWVEIAEEGLPADRRPIPPSGAVLAVRQGNGEAAIRVLDRDGSVLDEWILHAERG